MEAWAASALVVSHNKVKEVVPAEYGRFQDAVFNVDLTFDSWSIARWIQHDDDDSIYESIQEFIESDTEFYRLTEEQKDDKAQELYSEIENSLHDLLTTFKNKTGFTLYPFGTTDESDYPDGEGIHFKLSHEEVFQVKPEAKFLEGSLELSVWTEW